MLVRRWLLVGILAWSATMVGWTAGPDLKAERILMQAKEFMLGLQDFSARFSYSFHHPEMRHKVLPKDGIIKYQKGRYAIILDEQEIYCDQAEIWTWFKTDGEATVQTMDPGEGWSLEQIFNLYDVAEKPRYLGEDTLSGIPCHKIALAINKPDLDYNQATLWVDQTNKMFQQAILVDRKGTETSYRFFAHQLNPGFPAADFRFDATAHPSVQIIDERDR